jgi:hypothetical protein
MDPGTPLRDGRYVVRGLLGEGAQGETFEATDVRTGLPVAIKRFDVRGARSWKDVELAERETRVLATLDHPLVPRYIEHFEDDGGLYLVMQKVEGETLDAIRRREGPLPEAEVRRFLASADRALSYLHGRGAPVIHRDIKPRNVVRRPDGSYVLVDFGAVSELIARRGSSTIVGTMGYMAPEQFQGRALPATDVYGVAATALAALTGLEPEALPHKGLRLDVRAALQGRASPELITALERMLEPDPDERPTSLAAALEGIHASTPPSPRRGSRRRTVPSADAAEDALVKSVRGLLWVLWGLGWVLVPLVLRQLHLTQGVPIVMFGSLAALLIVTWHKSALLRAGLRLLREGGGAQGNARARGRGTDEDGIEAGPPRRRVTPHVRVAGEPQQVRVHTSDLGPEEQVSDTEVRSVDADAKARRRR